MYSRQSFHTLHPSSKLLGALARALATLRLRLSHTYVQGIRSLYCYLKDHHWELTANTLATLMIEPITIFKAAYLLLKRPINPNLNPNVLTPIQASKSPILLIHGDHSNSGLFGPLMAFLTQRYPHAPIFTVDLTSSDGLVSAAHHLDILLQKVASIQDLYPQHSTHKLILIGHSSGGDVLEPLYEKLPSYSVATMIKIGSIFKKERAKIWNHSSKHVLEIVGTRDVIEGRESYLNKHLMIDSGHVGLLLHPQVFHGIEDHLAFSR